MSPKWGKPLTNFEIDFLLQGRVPDYIGCMPDEQFVSYIREHKPERYVAVVNLQSGPPGTHWVLVSAKPEYARYVDPLGFDPEDIVLEVLPGQVSYNERRLQDKKSVSCGHICCVIAVFPDLLEQMLKNTADKNEALAHKYFKKLL